MKKETNVKQVENIPTFYLKYPIMPWIVWGLGAFFYFYEFALQTSISVMVPEFMHTFKISAGELGNFAAVYFYAYAFMQIPVGLLLDRFGARKLLTLASLLCALGAYLLANAHIFLMANLARLITGIGSAFAIVSCLHLAATWLPPKRFALITGVSLSIGMIGAVVGEAPFALLVNKLGWRNTLTLMSYIGIVLALLTGLIVRDRQPMAITKTSQSSNKSTPWFFSLKNVVRNLQVWIISIYTAFMFAPSMAFGALWGVPFLMKSHQVSRPIIATITSMVFVGWIFGAPFFGWIADSTGQRKILFFIGSSSIFVALIVIIYAAAYLPMTWLGILIFLFGFFSSAFLPAFGLIGDIVHASMKSTAFGFLNAINTTGVALIQLIVGIALDKLSFIRSPNHLLNHLPTYTFRNYEFAMSILPFCALIALLLLLFIKEVHHHQSINRLS